MTAFNYKLSRLKRGIDPIEISDNGFIFRSDLIAVKDTPVRENQKLGWSGYEVFYVGPDEVNFLVHEPVVITEGHSFCYALDDRDKVIISRIKVDPEKVRKALRSHFLHEAKYTELQEEEKRRQKRVKEIQKTLEKEFFA